MTASSMAEHHENGAVTLRGKDGKLRLISAEEQAKFGLNTAEMFLGVEELYESDPKRVQEFLDHLDSLTRNESLSPSYPGQRMLSYNTHQHRRSKR